MLESVVSAIIVLLMLSGLFFFLGASVGILRFPGFYTRMHAAGKADTLSSILILLGCAVYVISLEGVSFLTILLALKIVLVAAFIFVGSPTATHAMMDAGFETEVSRWRKEGDK
tara:strand:+ start:829 stop:1170 length:342 start_codon:yes stop_codon:yes gene_type:complete